MHRLYERYFLQHILWLKDGFRDYYVQPPRVRRWDIADVELKTIRDRERAVLWLESCLAYEDFYNRINLRTFLYEHSMCYVPVCRYDDRRVIFEVADMLRTNRYAIVVRPRFLSSAATIEPDSIFGHILGKKPVEVYEWGNGEFAQNAAQYAHRLTPAETAYLDQNNLAPIDSRALTDPQAEEAARLFGTSPEARALYANWRSRARIINHYKFTHPASVSGFMSYYRFARDVTPGWFAFERGWQIGTGKEMFTGQPISRTGAGLEFLLGIGVIKLFGAIFKAGRGAEAPKVRPPKTAKGKGMPEPGPPERVPNHVDDGVQKKYTDNGEGFGPKKTPETKLNPDDATNKKKVHGSAAHPRVEWRKNKGGVTRTKGEVVEIAEKAGIDTDMMDIHVVDDLPDNVHASYTGLQGPPDKLYKWADIEHDITGKVPVRLNKNIMDSDEAIIATLQHEAHELESLKDVMQSKGMITQKELARLIDSNYGGELHEEAWDVADELILKLRGD